MAVGAQQVSLTRVQADDLPHDIVLDPMHDWIELLEGDPHGLHLTVQSTGMGANRCGLPDWPMYSTPPVGCAVVTVANKTGLDVPGFVLEAFALKDDVLDTYDAPAGHMLAADTLLGPIAHSPGASPGPLWWIDPAAPTTVAFPVRDGVVRMGWRVLAQREACENGLDDDADGRVDEGCRAVPDGGSCALDLDCASGICRDLVCEENIGFWETLGVYALDWHTAKSSRPMLRSLPRELWPAGYIAAEPKEVVTTILGVARVADTPAKCDVPNAPPFTDDGVVCATLSPGVSTDAQRAPLFVEWIGGHSAVPAPEGLQQYQSFASLPAGESGGRPVQGHHWFAGVPRLRGGKSHVFPSPLTLNLLGSARGSAQFRVVRFVPATGSQKDVEVVANEIPPGPDTVVQDACLIDAAERPDVYDVWREFDQILDEIGWTASYLTNEFVAQAYGESSPFEYLELAFSAAELERVFGAAFAASVDGSFTESMDERPELVREWLAESERSVLWARLLAPDPTGERDSYWGLRAVAEHGALSNRAIDQVDVGCFLTSMGTSDESFERYATCPARAGRTVAPSAPCDPATSFEPMPGSSYDIGAACGGPPEWVDDSPTECGDPDPASDLGAYVCIPEQRTYVLPHGTYVVRHERSAVVNRPYHGPMPGYCESVSSMSQDDRIELPARNAERLERGDVPLAEYLNAVVTPPNARWGWPQLTFYGWNNVALEACGSSLTFELATARLGPEFSVPEEVAISEGDVWVPVCIDQIKVTRAESLPPNADVRLNPGVSYNSLAVLGSDDIAISNLRLAGDLGRVRFRYSGTGGGEPGLYHPAEDGVWNDFEGRSEQPYGEIAPRCLESGGDGEEGIDASLAAYFALVDVDGAQRTALRHGGELFTEYSLTNNRVRMDPVLTVSDGSRIALNRVSTRNGWEGMQLGDNNATPFCPGPSGKVANQAVSGNVVVDDAGTVDGSRINLAQPINGGLVPAFVYDIHTMPAMHNAGRYPRHRFSVPGICGALNCPVLELHVRGGWQSAHARNAVNVGNVRRALFDGTTFWAAGEGAEPGFRLTAPNAGIDFEPANTRNNIRVPLPSGSAAVLKAGQLNFVGVRVFRNRGLPISVYSGWGRVEDVRFIDSYLAAEEEARTPGILNAMSFGTDFVGNVILGGNDERTTLWADGASGVFEDNWVFAEGELTFGGNSACTTETLVVRDGPFPGTWESRPEASDENPYARSFALMLDDHDAACGGEYRGDSPYGRCRDVHACDPGPRGAVVEIAGEWVALDEKAVAFVRPAVDVDWATSYADTQVRAVRGNHFEIRPMLDASLPEGNANRWTGDVVQFNADIVADNDVCFRDDGGLADDAAGELSIRVSAPAAPWAVTGNDWQRGWTGGAMGCAAPTVEQPHVEFGPPLEYAGADSEEDALSMILWATGECTAAPNLPAGCWYEFETPTAPVAEVCEGDAPTGRPRLAGPYSLLSDGTCWADPAGLAERAFTDSSATLSVIADRADRRRADVDAVRAAASHWWFPVDRYARGDQPLDTLHANVEDAQHFLRLLPTTDGE